MWSRKKRESSAKARWDNNKFAKGFQHRSDDVPDRDYLFFHDLETSKMMEKCVCVCWIPVEYGIVMIFPRIFMIFP